MNSTPMTFSAKHDHLKSLNFNHAKATAGQDVEWDEETQQTVPGRWYVSQAELGCSKMRDTAEEALRNMLREHGCHAVIIHRPDIIGEPREGIYVPALEQDESLEQFQADRQAEDDEIPDNATMVRHPDGDVTYEVCHYFFSNTSAWHAYETEEEGRERFQNPLWIFRVPLPMEASYSIDHYAPQVEGMEQIEI